MRQDDPGSFWNARFGAEPTVYGEGPNVFFANQLEALSPGRILLPGDGEGRNAVHAAGQGWSVRSFDASSVGVEKALAHAAKRGVSDRTKAATHYRDDMRKGRNAKAEVRVKEHYYEKVD